MSARFIELYYGYHVNTDNIGSVKLVNDDGVIDTAFVYVEEGGKVTEHEVTGKSTIADLKSLVERKHK